MKHLSVTTLVGFLYYFDSKMPPSHVLRQAKNIHWKLGFDNTRTFTRYIKYEEELYEISGIPDKLDLKHGEVHELKTGRKLTEKVKNYALDQLQVYSWLTGLWAHRLYFYSTYSKKLVEVEKRKTSNREAERLIYDCLRRRSRMVQLLKV